MKGMKSNCWSAETLVRGVRAVAGQPVELMANKNLDDQLATVEDTHLAN